MNLNSQLFADPSPYPSIRCEGENPRYAAAMLADLGSCNSEMTAVSFYFYASLLTRDCFPDYSECFRRIDMVEMHHMDMLGQLALLLGTDPRLWAMDKEAPKYWSPSCILYPSTLPAIVKAALAGEKEAIKQYREQCSWIEDRLVLAVIRRIIKDEELHASILEGILEEIEPACR